MNSIKIENIKQKAFYGDMISHNMTVTPEGFLICLNVPIARTGTQEYLGYEIGVTGAKSNDIVIVTRKEKDVFNIDALASFEGKIVTNEHPEEDVTPSNYKKYTVGHVTNVHRGLGLDRDKVLADLVFYDRKAIKEIQNGKREISCGYSCYYEISEENNVCQTKIRGNHVALVMQGRAGNKISIKDSLKNKKQEGNMFKRKKNNSLISRIMRAVKDGDPAEVAEIIEDVTELQNEVDITNAILEETEIDLIDELEEELEESEENLETLFDENEIINDIEDDELELEKNIEMQQLEVNDVLLKLVRDMKPVIANIKDNAERKKVTKSLTKSIRKIKKIDALSSRDTYGQILKSKQIYNRKTLDSYSNRFFDNESLGKKIANKRNPHYK